MPADKLVKEHYDKPQQQKDDTDIKISGTDIYFYQFYIAPGFCLSKFITQPMCKPDIKKRDPCDHRTQCKPDTILRWIDVMNGKRDQNKANGNTDTLYNQRTYDISLGFKAPLMPFSKKVYSNFP